MLSAVKRRLHLGSPLENAPPPPSESDKKVSSLVSDTRKALVVQRNPMFDAAGERDRVRTYSFCSSSGSTLASRASILFEDAASTSPEPVESSPPALVSLRHLGSWTPNILRSVPERGAPSDDGRRDSTSLTALRASSTARAILAGRSNSGVADLEVAQAVNVGVASTVVTSRRTSRVQRIREGEAVVKKATPGKPPLKDYYRPSVGDRVKRFILRGRAGPPKSVVSGNPYVRTYHSNHMDFDRSERPGTSKVHVSASSGRTVSEELQQELPLLQKFYAYSRRKPSEDQLGVVLDVLQEIRKNGGVVEVRSDKGGKVQFGIKIAESSEGVGRGGIKKLEKLGATLIQKGYKVDCGWREGERLDPTKFKSWAKTNTTKKVKVAVSLAGLLLLLAV